MRPHRGIHQDESDAEDNDNTTINDDEPFAPDPSIPKDNSNPLDLPLLKLQDLDAMQKIARREIIVSSSNMLDNSSCRSPLSSDVHRVLSARSFVRSPRFQRVHLGRGGETRCLGSR